MHNIGLDIQGMDMTQVSRRMEEYLAKHFENGERGVVIANGTGIFQEVVRLAYGEIDHLLVQPDEVQLFSDDDWFNCASGTFEITNLGNDSSEELTAMLLLNDEQTKALFLYVQKEIDADGELANILVKDFTKGQSL